MEIRNPYRYKPLQVVLAAAAMVVSTMPAHAESGDPSSTLWYSSPARNWQHEALPIGNGRLGAMIFGGVGQERIALNEDTVWSGSRVNWNRQGASKNLPIIRERLLAGKNADSRPGCTSIGGVV